MGRGLGIDGVPVGRFPSFLANDGTIGQSVGRIDERLGILRIAQFQMREVRSAERATRHVVYLCVVGIGVTCRADNEQRVARNV